MFRSFTIPPALVGAIAIVPSFQTTAAAKTSVEIGEIAQAISVKIQTEDSIGTGVIVHKQGNVYTVLTSAHVVKFTNGKYRISTADDREYAPKLNSIRHSSEDLDLALLQFESGKNYPIAKLGDSSKLKIGMNSYVGGFPAPTAVITESVFTFRRGEISASSSKSFDKGYSLLYSNDTLPGMSGGPILNDAGEVVGIHGRGDRDTATGVKTNFNAGIPILQASSLIQTIGIDVNIKTAVVPKNAAPKADDFFITAYQKYQQRNYNGALKDYDRAIAINPKYAEAWNNRGHLKAVEMKNPQGGLADYNQAIATNPKLDRAYYNRGVLKAELKDIGGAISDYNSTIAINPSYARAYNNRGILYQDRGNIQGAIADFNTALKLDPSYPEAYYNRAMAKESVGDKTAMSDNDRAIALNPKYSSAYNNRGIIHQKNGNPAKALADFDRAIAISPKYVEAYSNRGALKYEALNDRDGAIADFTAALSIDPRHTPAYCNRGLVKDDMGNAAGAMDDFKQAAASNNPNAIDAIFSKAAIDLKQGRMDSALKGFQRAIDLNRDYADAYLYQGLTNRNLGDKSNAIASFRTAVNLYKNQGQKRSHQKALARLKELEKSTPKTTREKLPAAKPTATPAPIDSSF
jgi:tetratricopeptide (TPR) repeat protein/S1-C subfamily serine protease